MIRWCYYHTNYRRAILNTTAEMCLTNWKTGTQMLRWFNLSRNTNAEAVEMLKKTPEKINWGALSYNPSPEAVELLKKRPNKIAWYNISAIRTRKPWSCWSETQKRSVGGICLLIRIRRRWNCWNRTPKIDWANLSGNTNAEAVELLKQNPDKISWIDLSSNTNSEAVCVVEGNPSKINWVVYRVIRTRKPWNAETELLHDWLVILSRNSNADAVELLKKIQIKLFTYRSTNTEAGRVVKSNPDKIRTSTYP
jgi:hypothetical protein